MIRYLLLLAKYWKVGGVIVLTAVFLLGWHLAHSRGEKLRDAQAMLETEREKFSTQIKIIEKARQDEKERNGFRKTQNKKIKLADDSGLRDAYERLRERHSAKLTR